MCDLEPLSKIQSQICLQFLQIMVKIDQEKPLLDCIPFNASTQPNYLDPP